MRRLAIALLAVTTACSAAPRTIDLGEVKRELDRLWEPRARARASSTAVPPGSWMPAESPWFPDEWPPGPHTTWTKYAFAYRPEPGRLGDAVRVARPWAVVRFHRARSATTVQALGGDVLVPVDVQGVRPLRPEEVKMLETEDTVARYVLGLTAAPDPEAAAAVEMRAFYAKWLECNGAFVRLVRADHAAFFEAR